MDYLEKLKDLNKKINAIWLKGVAFFLLIIFLFALGKNLKLFPERPPLQEQLKPILEADFSIDQTQYKNCNLSSSNENVDTSPLKTNDQLGKIDLIEDTDKITDKKNLIPPVYNPKFITLDEAKDCIKPNEIIYALTIEDQTHIYTYSVLAKHQIIHDMFQITNKENETISKEVIVTYSPYSDSISAFITSEIFGNSGRLYKGINLLFDTKTESLWLQINGEAIIGNRTGERIEHLPIRTLTFEEAGIKFPEGSFLSFDTGYITDYSKDPYKDFHTNDQIVGKITQNISTNLLKEKVIAIDYSGEQKAYLLNSSLQDEDLIDKINEEEIKIYKNMEFDTYEIAKIDNNGNVTTILPSVQMYLYSWKEVFPNSKIYSNKL
ncbi:DUF3179 domain-containing protein [Candidatus Dojkabacteria bacterium]|nr:DUF3179 domain-containing protein [Candidatus Dojkabacteria bacterium]